MTAPFTPVPPLPAQTQAQASAALQRLVELGNRLNLMMNARPAPAHTLLDALAPSDGAAPDTALQAQETAALLLQLEAYWDAPDTLGTSRYATLLGSMAQAWRDELSVRIHENTLQARHADCLPAHTQDAHAGAPSCLGLHLQLAEEEQAEVAGALVMVHEQGHALLMLPGIGAIGFASRAELAATLAGWLNDPLSSLAVLNGLELRHQDLLTSVRQATDLYLEPFTAEHVLLIPVTDAPYAHTLDRLRHKQREDVHYACTRPDISDRQARQALIQAAIAMQGLFGPAAMLELRELDYRERRYRQSLPDWIKIAGQDDLNRYSQYLQAYEQTRSALLGTLNAAASPEQFAKAHLHARLLNDLGHDLDPAAITVSTRRSLQRTGETCTVTRSLVDLALYGLHPGDLDAGSAFLEHTTLSLDGAALPAAWSSLTPAYLAQVIESLDLRLAFASFQRSHYQKAHNRQLMHLLTRRQIAALAFAAKMQGHIQPEDLTAILALTATKSGTPAPGLSVHQVRLAGQVMSKLLVFRQVSADGQLERLVLVAVDAPHHQYFKSFIDETRLLHELVGWTASPDLSDYLLNQLTAEARAHLAPVLAGLRLKPYPAPGFLELASLADFEAALHAFVDEHVRVALSEQARHTPDWYRHASAGQRQQLLALEDLSRGAHAHYQAQLHTHLQPFRAYVHDRASQQLSTLLNTPAGRVDPDQVLIISERETLTYTDMLLNGYDDSISLLHASADTEATFSGPPGVDLSALSPMVVARSVRGKWLADDYIAQVKATLLDPLSPGYEYRRNASVMMTQLHMKAAALRSLLKGHVDATQYQWLNDAIDHAHLSDGATRERYPLYPLQIHIDKPFIGTRLPGIDQLVIPDPLLIEIETVQGCVAVLPTEVRQAALLYTPQAPDGLEFRLFASFMESLGSPGMIDYYKDRCRSQARKNLAFLLRDMQQGNANKAPFLPREPIADFADICFNRRILRQLREVEDTTTGRNDMLARLAWHSVELIATLVTLPFPPASFAVGAAMYLHDTVRALQALSQGDSDQAGVYLLTAMLNSLGAAGDLHAGLKGFGSFVRQGNSPSLPPLSRQPSLPRYEDLFPVTLYDEPFLLGKPDLNGHFPILRPAAGTASLPAPAPTGQLARPASQGSWQPLGTMPETVSASGLYERRAVPLSLHDVPRLNEGHGRGVHVLDGNHYIELSGQTWQVQYDAQLRCWQIIDPANPFAFFGKQPVRLDEHGTWQLLRRPGLHGGGLDTPSPYTPLPDPAQADSSALSALAPYQLPPSMQPHLEVILDGRVVDSSGLGLEAYFEAHFQTLRQTFADRREQLYQHARAFFLEAPVPPRPILPAQPMPISFEALIDTCFAHGNGLVLGETPKSIASKRLLILNMPLLAEQRVEVLYIEHVLFDKHLNKLARYRRLGKKSRAGSHEIKEFLEELNGGALDNLSSEHDYYHLIKAAHRQGIEVRPLNSSISYPFVAHPVPQAADDALASRKMSVFFGHKLISSDVASDPTRRWIALVDHRLAVTHDQLPGLAELQGVPGVAIEDLASGRATRAFAADATRPFDFILQSANPLIIAPALPPSTSLDTVLFNSLGSQQGVGTAERWAGDYGFAWNGRDRWLWIEPERWTSNSPLTAIQQSLQNARYEMPPADRVILHELAQFKHKGLDENYMFLDPEQARVRTLFFNLRRTLQKDAQQILTLELPPRPTLPEVAPQTRVPDFLEKLYQHTDRVVIGESHNSIASKQLIIDNLPLLARHNVKTLYMEHLLTDLHQADLDRFFETGQMSKTLLHDLKRLDRGHHTDPGGHYTFERLVIDARTHGLEVRAIDCTASYFLKGIRNEAATTRQQMMNYFAWRTIDTHQQVMGTHKWIALVGNSHANTFGKVVPGLAELHGAIGVRVVDVPPGHATGVLRDPGESLKVDHVKADTAQVKSDYRVNVEVAQPSAFIRAPVPLSTEQRLDLPGKFLVEQGEDGLFTIVHRSRDRQLHRTPVQRNDEGRLYVDRPTWTAVHMTPYQDMDALIIGLESMNLTRAG